MWFRLVVVLIGSITLVGALNSAASGGGCWSCKPCCAGELYMAQCADTQVEINGVWQCVSCSTYGNYCAGGGGGGGCSEPGHKCVESTTMLLITLPAGADATLFSGQNRRFGFAPSARGPRSIVEFLSRRAGLPAESFRIAAVVQQHESGPKPPSTPTYRAPDGATFALGAAVEPASVRMRLSTSERHGEVIDVLPGQVLAARVTLNGQAYVLAAYADTFDKSEDALAAAEGLKAQLTGLGSADPLRLTIEQ